MVAKAVCVRGEQGCAQVCRWEWEPRAGSTRECCSALVDGWVGGAQLGYGDWCRSWLRDEKDRIIGVLPSLRAATGAVPALE